MRFSSILLTTLAALASAAPVEKNTTALEARADPPLIMFFSDRNCQNARASVVMHPNKFKTGVPYGVTEAHSAFFQNINGLASWQIQAGKTRSPKEKVMNPAVNRCVGYSDEVFIVADTSLVVHS